MSWLFSQALVAEYSAVTCSGGVPSAPLNVMPTPHKFWRNDKTMEPSQLSRFGLTCAVLTEDHGAALLTWFLADSRVRTYQLPGMVTVSTVLAQVSGEKWRESSARYDLITSTWKTHLCLWDEDLPWSSVTLPKTGPELEVTGPSRIFNANQTASMIKGGGNDSATVAELRGLRAEMQSNFEYIGRHIKATAEHTGEMNESGIQVVGTVDTKAVAA